MKKLLLIAMLSMGVIGLFALSPDIRAIVEPHITINMDPGQTTKPFVINDNLGTEVFSVNVDGKIFPASFTGNAGTEIAVLSNTYDDASGGYRVDAAGGISAGAEFTLPSTSPLWKITAVETKTGNVVGPEGYICVGVIDSQTNLPLNNRNVAIGTLLAYGRSNVTVTGSNQMTINTVYKSPTTSHFIKGGTDLIVYIEACGNTGTKFTGQASAARWTELSSSIKPTFPIGNFLVETDGIEYYIKVYAEPYG